MSNPQSFIALNAQALPAPEGGADVPEWVHLLPTSSGEIETGDARGPYVVGDANQIIAMSFADADKLAIDVNHATDLAAPNGLPAPAHGWIVEMQARADGIWGRVDWNESGIKLLASRAYRGISPVVSLPHKASKKIVRILRASLTNRPNMRGLTALNQENDDMSFLADIAAQLGLETDASQEDVTGAIGALKGKDGGEAGATALQSQLNDIATALGVDGDGEPAAILAAAKAKAGENDDGAITALQAEVTTLTTSLNTEREARARKDAETYVDGEILKGRVGLKPVRDRYIAMHMKDPAEAVALIGVLPVLGETSTTILPPEGKDGAVSLNVAESSIATMLGVSAEDYTKTLKEEDL